MAGSMAHWLLSFFLKVWGVLFITLEDETDAVANVIVWPSLFERQRRHVLTAGLMGVTGRVQRQGEVIHLVAEHLSDYTHLLATLGARDGAVPLPHGRGDKADGGRGSDTRGFSLPGQPFAGEIKVRTRDFR